MKKILYGLGAGVLSIASLIGGCQIGQKLYQERDPFRYIDAGAVEKMQEQWGGLQFLKDDKGNFAAIALPKRLENLSK